MNNHQLLHVSSDVIDMEPITPNHLLLGRPQPVVPISIRYKSWRFSLAFRKFHRPWIMARWRRVNPSKEELTM